MATFRAQFTAAAKTNQAVRAVEASARMQAVSISMLAAAARVDKKETERSLVGVVADAYQASAALAVAHLSAQIGVPRWKPRTVDKTVRDSEYLQGLQDDVVRNLRLFWRGDIPHVKSLSSRVSHSAGVAAARGYTDAMISASRELSELHGFILRKVWRANFVNHTPCALCAELDGTSVAMDKDFPSSSTLAVYGDLLGPPRHPRCMCWLVVLVEGLENYEDPQDGSGSDSEPQSLTTDQIQKMKPAFYLRVVRWLRVLVRTLRGA